MTFDQYQTEALRTAGNLDRREALSMTALGLAGESAEVLDACMPAMEAFMHATKLSSRSGATADSIKKSLYHGHTLNRDKLTEELSDVLWYVAVLAHINGVPLSEVAAVNVRKLLARYPQGFSEERSRNRAD